MFLRSLTRSAAFNSVVATGALLAQAQTAAPKAEKGYTLTVFAHSPAGQSKPDSIAVFESHIYIGYGNGNAPGGTDGKSNNIYEYDRSGHILSQFTVKGHNDGLKVDPYTGKLWVLQNEDSNPSLVIYDPESRTQKSYGFAQPPASGGGYDDIVFRNHKTYLSASNPAQANNTQPAIVEAKIQNGIVYVTPVLEGNASATNVITGQTAALNLQDPDSMTLAPSGDIVLDSQADSELIVVRKPGARQQTVQVVPLSSPYGQPQVDDTLFTPSSDGFLLITDTGANLTYKLTKASFAPGVPYSAGAAGGIGFVGRLDLEFGQLTPVATGLVSPHGLAFVTTEDEDRRNDKDRCEDDNGR